MSQKINLMKFDLESSSADTRFCEGMPLLLKLVQISNWEVNLKKAQPCKTKFTDDDPFQILMTNCRNWLVHLCQASFVNLRT